MNKLKDLIRQIAKPNPRRRPKKLLWYPNCWDDLNVLKNDIFSKNGIVPEVVVMNDMNKNNLEDAINRLNFIEIIKSEKVEIDDLEFDYIQNKESLVHSFELKIESRHINLLFIICKTEILRDYFLKHKQKIDFIFTFKMGDRINAELLVNKELKNRLRYTYFISDLNSVGDMSSALEGDLNELKRKAKLLGFVIKETSKYQNLMGMGDNVVIMQ